MIVRVGGASVGVVACGVGVGSMRVNLGDVGRAVAVARYDTVVRAAGTGVVVVVIAGLIDTSVAASAGATGVSATAETRGAAAVAVPATPPLPVATDVAPASVASAGVASAGVAPAGAVIAPGLIVVTAGVAVGPLTRRPADVIAPAPPLEVLAPPLEVPVAETGTPFAGAETPPVAPDTETAVGVPFVAPAVPLALGPLPFTLPCAARPVAGVAVG